MKTNNFLPSSYTDEELKKVVKQIRKEKRNRFPIIMRNETKLIIITEHTYKFYSLESEDNNTNWLNELEMAKGSGYKIVKIGILEEEYN